MGKSQLIGPTQTDRGGSADPFLAYMWERDGSARTTERSAHASARASSCPADPTWQPDCVKPSFPPLVLTSLRHRFGLVQRVVNGAFMPLLAVCAGHQCRRLDDRAGAASGQRHAARVQRIYKAPPRTPRAAATHTRRHSPPTAYEYIMTGRWPFSRKTKHDDEASGSGSGSRDRRRMSPPPLPCPPPPSRHSQNVARAPHPTRGLRDRVYVPVRLARRLYARGNPVPWPDVNLPARWHLNSQRVPVPPVPRNGLERVREIHRRRGLLPMHLRHDPAFDIGSPNWDTFSRWELRPDRRAGYLGDAD
jgi:hypothetical protein